MPVSLLLPPVVLVVLRHEACRSELVRAGRVRFEIGALTAKSIPCVLHIEGSTLAAAVARLKLSNLVLELIFLHVVLHALIVTGCRNLSIRNEGRLAGGAQG